MSKERYAEHLYSVPGIGRTVDVVRCSCGATNRWYRWSWAGHGKARCTACRAWINYYGLRVVPDAKKKVAR